MFPDRGNTAKRRVPGSHLAGCFWHPEIHPSETSEASKGLRGNISDTDFQAFFPRARLMFRHEHGPEEGVSWPRPPCSIREASARVSIGTRTRPFLRGGEGKRSRRGVEGRRLLSLRMKLLD